MDSKLSWSRFISQARHRNVATEVANDRFWPKAAAPTDEDWAAGSLLETMRASLTLIMILGVFLLSFEAYGQMRGGGMMSMIRHHFVMQNGVDPKYASKVNPLERNAENIAAGKKLYEKSCALCHGMTGVGDGEAGKDLKPPPANITMFIRMHSVPDGYLYWTIAEGGMPLQTAMPPFKDVMKEDEIWKTIIFLREL